MTPLSAHLRIRRLLCPVLACVALFSAGWLPHSESRIEEYRIDGLEPDPMLSTVGILESTQESQLNLASLGIPSEAARLDLRTGRWAALWPSEPMLSAATRHAEQDELENEAKERLNAYIEAHQEALRIDTAEIHWNVGIHDGGRLIQMHGQRRYQGLDVRGSYVTASLVEGRLVLFGTRHWGDVDISIEPSLTLESAWAQTLTQLNGVERSTETTGYLELIPIAESEGNTKLRRSLIHRLAWVIPFRHEDGLDRYLATVDAQTGEMIEITDTFHAERNVKGGVYPISNDGMDPDGIEQPGWPMPFADVTHSGGTTTTDAGGNVDGVTGSMTTTLSGPYVTIDEGCGAVSETSADGDLDLGTSGGTDCDTPAGGSAGNTHSARTAFYEVNRMVEMGRTRLPANNWVRTPLPVTLNSAAQCNAFWTGTNLLFFQEQAPCSNLGELAGVLDHEWGHGMDDNGTNGSVSSPGEGIADVYAALRLGDSCPGRGALPNVCSGFGDACIEAFGCTAARDIDWQRRESQQPHDVAWVNANCAGSSHCLGTLTSESIWDLYKRDLPAQHGMDDNTAMEVATRLTFLGADNVGSWFSTSNGNEGGCAANSGYQQFLVADDDNGNLNDGTPHMQAIFNAFDRHGIACSTPTVQVSGCAGAPTTAPTVAASATDRGAELSWNAVSGATRYKIYRTDGVRGCGRGKALVGEVTGTSFTDTGLQNDREYNYVVAGFNGSDTCMGPAGPCTTVTAGQSSLIFSDGFESGDLSAW